MLAVRGGHENRAWRVLQHAECHAAEEPGREFAAAGRAEHDQIGVPFGRLGDDRLGCPVDDCLANLTRGRDPCHPKLESS